MCWVPSCVGVARHRSGLNTSWQSPHCTVTMPTLAQPLSLLSMARDTALRILISKSEYGDHSWAEAAAELIPPTLADYFLDKVIQHCVTREQDYFLNFSSLFNSRVKQIRIQAKCSDKPENISSVLSNLSNCTCLQQVDLSADICKKIPATVQDFVLELPCAESVKILRLGACQDILSEPDITLKFLASGAYPSCLCLCMCVLVLSLFKKNRRYGF